MKAAEIVKAIAAGLALALLAMSAWSLRHIASLPNPEHRFGASVMSPGVPVPLPVLIAGGTDGGAAQNVQAVGATPAAPVGLPGVDGGGTATLPAAGAFETAPTTAADAGAPVPISGTAAQIRGCNLVFVYTAADAGGSMSVKLWAYDGATWGQIASPVDQSYSALAFPVGNGRYSVQVDVKYGITRLMVTGAETGLTGAPGAYVSEIACN